jgi:hypothetical protein
MLGIKGPEGEKSKQMKIDRLTRLKQREAKRSVILKNKKPGASEEK